MRARAACASVAFVAASMLTTCGSTATQPQGLPTRAEVEAVYAKRADALARGDLASFEATYDQARAALRRWQADEFSDARQGLIFERVRSVQRVEPFGESYVRAYVDVVTDVIFGVESPSHVIRAYFRRVGDRVVLSEPIESELGAQRSRTDGLITVTYREIDDELGPLVLLEMANARSRVERFAPRGFASAVTIRLVPTAAALGPNWESHTLTQADDSRAVGTWAPLAMGVDPSLHGMAEMSRAVVQSELARFLRGQVVPNIHSRLIADQWLSDGWIHYVSGATRADFFKPVCAGVPAPTLSELSLPPNMRSGLDYAIRYGFQRSMVEYMYERFGSTAYWDLLAAYMTDASARVTFPKVLKATPDQYYADWLAWAKKKLC